MSSRNPRAHLRHGQGSDAAVLPEPDRRQGGGAPALERRGGLVGAAIVDINDWKRTVAINLVFGNGARARVPAGLGYGAERGLITSRAVFNREAETLPPAQNYLP